MEQGGGQLVKNKPINQTENQNLGLISKGNPGLIRFALQSRQKESICLLLLYFCLRKQLLLIATIATRFFLVQEKIYGLQNRIVKFWYDMVCRMSMSKCLVWSGFWLLNPISLVISFWALWRGRWRGVCSRYDDSMAGTRFPLKISMDSPPISLSRSMDPTPESVFFSFLSLHLFILLVFFFNFGLLVICFIIYEYVYVS